MELTDKVKDLDKATIESLAEKEVYVTLPNDEKLRVNSITLSE